VDVVACLCTAAIVAGLGNSVAGADSLEDAPAPLLGTGRLHHAQDGRPAQTPDHQARRRRC